MGNNDKIVKKLSDIESAQKEEIIMKKILINEIKDKLKLKIGSNDPAFMKTLKYLLSDSDKREKQE